ncbi:MAG: ABC transporter permease [Burkholderiales bacterium]|jgi:ABC-2 type transport system permease protein|nr:ABC transporter permease [Burkholderiales bacterium]
MDSSSAAHFSWRRVWAVLLKEFIQLKRERLTFAMVLGIPVIQLILFGYAINSDPRHLPTALVVADNGPFAASVVAALQNTAYFTVVAQTTQEQADRMILEGDVQFALVIPSDFSTRLLRGERPAIAVYADATDPAATGSALAALAALPQVALINDLKGPLAHLAPWADPFQIVVHRRYNPEGITAYNVVPGLIGVILTMTLILMTSMAVTRERERGTLENLLATPVRPFEMMTGKILPYMLIGYLQVVVIYAAARLLFAVPMAGSFGLLSVAVLIFMLSLLTVGFTFSTLAASQVQSMQMTLFFFLPNILLSGFMFPFRGMPVWAQWIGKALPLTHFLRIVRAIMLKGAGPLEVLPQVWPILAFTAVVGAVALTRYRQTLD